MNYKAKLHEITAFVFDYDGVISDGNIWSANTLPNLLMELYPVLVKKGYKFTTVSKSGGLITP